MSNNAHVLVVDDDPESQIAAGHVLRALGCTVKCVGDGTEAVTAAAIAQPKYDLILLDIVMPHMNGLEAARQIRAADPGIVVVAITSYATDAARKACEAAGMAAVMAKPVTVDELRRLLPPAPRPVGP